MVETTGSGERGRNPVAMTVINLRESNQRPPVLKSATLPTELWGSVFLGRISLPIPTQQHLLTPLGNKPFENTVGKGEIAHNEQFRLYPQCFLPI